MFLRFYLKQQTQIINPLTTKVPHHTGTSQLICNANQLTGFYIMGNICRLGLTFPEFSIKNLLHLISHKQFLILKIYPLYIPLRSSIQS